MSHNCELCNNSFSIRLHFFYNLWLYSSVPEGRAPRRLSASQKMGSGCFQQTQEHSLHFLAHIESQHSSRICELLQKYLWLWRTQRASANPTSSPRLKEDSVRLAIGFVRGTIRLC